jgi:TorA maturation chaperone TorD
MILTSIEQFKIFGALCYYRQDETTFQQQVTALHHEQAVSTQTITLSSQLDVDDYHAQFLALFEGCGDMQAPPWGSVYLDREQVLFGESTLAYRQFLKNNHIEHDTHTREPEDQFGLMLLATAYLVERGQQDEAKELLSEHLFTWAPTYLERLSANTSSPFYASLAKDLVTWIDTIRQELSLTVPVKTIYR